MAKQEPASIRYKNPGAMWGNNAFAARWGATATVGLSDGKGQGNNIAVFPTYVAGICAQMDLWRSSKLYKNKKFADAIATWSGHNEVESYIKFVIARVPGMTRNTVMNEAFWRGDKAIPFLKAQAWHEAGKKYPAPDGDWVEAWKRVLGGEATPVAPTPVGNAAPEVIAPKAPSLTQPSPADKNVPKGDPDIWNTQRRLEAMKYFPGDWDGKWGGNTGGAITGFINDRGLALTAPTSAEMFAAIYPDLKSELAKAETEGFTRPIAVERAEATDAKVAAVSAVIPAAKQNGLMAWILGIPATLLTFFSGVASFFKELWDNDTVVSVREFASDNIGLIAAAIALFAVYQWITAQRAKNATKEAYKEGRLS